jgi:beta-phosphoglucomutase-like phosphatase (HAD superfamily)
VPALIFDYDGVIADTERLVGSVLVDLLAARGIEIGFESMVSFMGSTGVVNDAAWAGWVETWLGPDEDPVAFDVMAWELIEAQRHEVPLCAGVVELLDEAARLGWQVAIGTGAHRPRLEHHLSHLGVLDRFAVIVTAAEVERGKPAPDVFLEAARQLGADPSHVLVVEDSLNGLKAGRAAGMTTVLIPNESVPPAAGSEEEADVVLERITELDPDAIDRASARQAQT